MHWPSHFILIFLLDPCGKTLKTLRNQVLYQLQLGVPQDPKKIAEVWKNHFRNLLNSVVNDEYKEIVYKNITCKNSYMRYPSTCVMLILFNP